MVKRIGIKSLFGVVYHFLVKVIRDVADKEDREGDDLFGIKREERTEDFVWAAKDLELDIFIHK